MARPYYEPGVVRVGFVLDEGVRASLLLDLAVRMEASRLMSATFRSEGHTGRYSLPLGALPEVSVAELAAAALAAEGRHRGAEFDRVVRDTAGLHAVTVRHDLDGELRVFSRRLDAAPGPREPAPEDWSSRFGVPRPESGGADWTPRQLALLAEALAALGPGDLAAIEGLVFRREVAPPASHADFAALYRSDDTQRWVEVYDQAFLASDHAFVGALSDPRPPGLRIILHEIGHAVARAGGLQTGRAFRERASALRDLVDPLNRLGVRVTEAEFAVLTGLQKRIERLADRIRNANPRVTRAIAASDEVEAFRSASGRGVTVYGRTSIEEAYAEAFALALLDPEALRRADPEAFTYFRSKRDR